MGWKHLIHIDEEFYELDHPNGLTVSVVKPGGLNSWWYRCRNRWRMLPGCMPDMLKLESKELEGAKKEALSLINKELTSLQEQVLSMIEWNSSLEQNTIKDL